MSANTEWPPVVGDGAHVPVPARGAGRAAWHRYRQAVAHHCFGPPPPAMWLVQAKVVSERPFGPGGTSRRSGLRLLRGLSKVHVVKFWRNASPARVTVVGRHRVTGRYLSVIVATRHLGDFSVHLVRSPSVIAQHWEQPRQRFAYGRDREAAEAVMATLCEANTPAARGDADLPGTEAIAPPSVRPWWRFW